MIRDKKLKLMPEVHCWPVWNVDDAGNVDPSLLPLSEALIADLNKWSERFDTIYRLDEANFHLDVSFASKEEENIFYDDGWKLLDRLKQEMPDVEWLYRDHRQDGLLSEKPSI